MDRMCQLGANRNPGVSYRISLSPNPKSMSPNTSNWGFEKPLFQFSANRLEVDETVNSAHFRIHWLVVK